MKKIGGFSKGKMQGRLFTYKNARHSNYFRL
jgi:hypothetical protein